MYGFQQAFGYPEGQYKLPLVQTLPQDPRAKKEEGKHWLDLFHETDGDNITRTPLRFAN
jgi:hypothetical protein